MVPARFCRYVQFHNLLLLLLFVDARDGPSKGVIRWICLLSVYHLVQNHSNQVVARKIIRILGNVREDDIANEVRAIDKLCSSDQGHHLVEVFHHEQCSSGLLHITNDLHQIDMELCVRNLGDEIKADTKSLQEILTQIKENARNSESDFNELSLELSTKTVKITVILTQILEALEFIHSHKEVHRDLKPENGFPQ